MSGHSKWSTIKHKKGALDAKRGKLFTKLSKEIIVAAREGSDPEMNFRLRLAIQNAKDSNMPSDNIERSIKKGSGEDTGGAIFEEITYEGYGPGGTAFILQALTDNKNRTASNIRTIFQKAGGNLGTQGSASHNFNQLGIIKIDESEISEEEILDLAIESGAEECKSNNEYHEIQCSVKEIYNVKKELEKEIENFISTEIEWIPLNNVEVSKEKNDNLINFFESLEDDDDVQNVYSNAEFTK